MVDEFTYPVAKKLDIKDNFHGKEVPDPYRWMEDPHDPEVVQWMRAQNKLVDEYVDLADVARSQERLTELFDYPRYGIPSVRGDMYFYSKNEGLQPQPVYYKQQGIDGAPEVLFDANILSEDGTTAVVQTFYSDDGKYVALAISVHGSDWQEIKILDIETGEFLEDYIENVRNGASIQWLKDNSGFYYSAFVGKDESFGGQKLWWHTLGTPQVEDKMVFEHPEDDELWVFSQIDDDEEYMFLTMIKSTMPENLLYFKKLGDETFQPVINELKHRYFIPVVHDGIAVVYTNEDADNYKVMVMDLKNPSPENWTELIPEKDTPLSAITVTNGHLLLTYVEDVKHRVYLYDFSGNLVTEIDLPTFGSIFATGRKFQKDLFLLFTSFVYPNVVFRYDFKNGQLTEFFENPLEIDAGEYQVKQIFYPSKDGIKVPMFIMHRHDIEPDGNLPTVLYGYGGFGISMTPFFSQRALHWMELGGVFAVANLRGGGEYGEQWHHAGMLEKKQNVFDDFIAGGEWLIKNGYTNSSKLAIFGGSNGGLLTAACMLQRPDLFGAVITAVGVLDMLRYHLWTIGRFWVPEYGDPNNPEDFEFLMKYSPLHNVEEKEYPPTFVYSADTDDRVDPSHSRKYVATLQEKGMGGPLLLRMIIKAGHGMGKPITKLIEDMSYEFAFLKKALKM